MRRLILAALLFVGACSPGPPPETDGTWVGAITTEGNVTTVVNESGSVWGGTATLVEEASIGVESGAEAYMLGRVSGVAADEDRIYLLDAQLPALRIYDREGVHLFDIAPIGQGPGEFQRPDGFVLAPDGGLYVTDFNTGRRLVSFEPDGSPRATVQVQGLYQAEPYRVDENGVATLLVRGEIAEVAPDGSILSTRARPAFDRSPWIVRTAPVEGFSAAAFAVPFAPNRVWELTADGSLVTAITSEYRITIEHPDGTTLVIERKAALIPLEPAETEWHDRVFRAALGAGWGPVQGAIPPTPDFKPAMSQLIADHDSSFWVVRPGPGERLPDCAASATTRAELRERPCWRDATIIEAFGLDGRYLGEVEIPDGFRTYPRPALHGDRVVAAVEDEAGTIMVKRYRLVRPG